jgi:hypothetical protein
MLWSVNIAAAQTALDLADLEVDIWPEYDRPSVLIIYRITLAPVVSLPANVRLRIPTVSGEPNAVAAKQLDGALYSLAYDRQVNGEWAYLDFTATLPELQVEYYDPQIQQQGNERQYKFLWPGDFNIDSLTVQVQQPFDSYDLHTSPGLGSAVVGQDGLQYYSAEVGALDADQTFEISIEYVKDTNTLTAESLQVQPSAPVDVTTAGWQNQLVSALPWGLGILGVVLIVGGGLWYWQSGRGGEASEKPRRRRKASSQQETLSDEEHSYCHQCGKRASGNDRFCRACGARLRVE